MKKILAMLLAVLLVCSMSACGSKQSVSADGMTVVIDANEYNLYQDIFYNGNAAQYTGKQVTKTGIFTTVYDTYYDITRYYVWGFYDKTKCCDWQWELKLEADAVLPANGSLITASGSFEYDESALDKYWLTGASVEVKTPYDGASGDIDMTTMSATLELVQLSRLQLAPAQFAGKTIRVYGRIVSPTSLQHPFYDGAWTLDYSYDGQIPAAGTEVIVTGTYQDDGDGTGSLLVTALSENPDL